MTTNTVAKLLACGCVLLAAGRSGWGAAVSGVPVPAAAPQPTTLPEIDIGDYDAVIREKLAKGEFHRALEWVQREIENDPEEVRARFIRAVLNSQRWHSRDCRADLELVAAVEPLNGLVLAARAQLALIDRVHEPEALTLLGHLSQSPRGGYWVARFVGKVHVERGEHAQAVRLLRPLVESASRADPWLLDNLSIALANTGEVDNAVALSRQAVSMLPHRVLYRGLAARLYRRGDHAAADEAMKEAIARYPRRDMPLDLFTDSLKAEPDVKERIRRYEYVMGSALDAARGRLQQAGAMRGFGAHEAAVVILEELAAAAPLRYRAEAMRTLGRLYDSGAPGIPAQPDKARSFLRQAAELGDGQAAGLLAFQSDYPARGRRAPAEAHRHYQQAVLRGDIQSLTNFGIMLRSGRGIPKDPEKALILYLKAMQAGSSTAHNNAAWLLLNEPRFWNAEAAANWAEIGARQQPGNQNFNTLIRVYLRTGELDAADHAWRRWHRWWTREHGRGAAVPGNFQGLRETIDRGLNRAKEGEAS